MPPWHTITMTHPCYFNTISGTCWKMSEFIDFDLKKRNSNLPARFSALICDFSQFIKFHYQKLWKLDFKNIWKCIIYGLIKVRKVSYIQIYSSWNSLSIDLTYSSERHCRCEIRNKKWFSKLLSIWHSEQIVTMTLFQTWLK